MCLVKTPEISATKTVLAAPRSTEGVRSGAIEQRLRRSRASAASRILTSPIGIPAGRSTAQLGAVA